MRYGFLTTYRYTYFFKYMGPKHYAITDAILSSAAPTTRLRSPSVAAILYCESDGPLLCIALSNAEGTQFSKLGPVVPACVLLDS